MSLVYIEKELGLSDAEFWARLEELRNYSPHQLSVMAQMIDEWMEKREGQHA